MGELKGDTSLLNWGLSGMRSKGEKERIWKRTGIFGGI